MDDTDTAFKQETDDEGSAAPAPSGSLDAFKQETDDEGDATTSPPPERPAAAARLEWGWAMPPLVVPPSHLPDPAGLLRFDVDEKKNEIFEAAREKIRSKAQYTKNVSSHHCTAYSYLEFYST